MNIKAVALTEKGAVKPAVRKAIVEKIAKNPELFAEATKVGPSLYTLTATDSNGDNIYINFKISVGTLSADNYATKTKVTTTDEIIVEQSNWTHRKVCPFLAKNYENVFIKF